MKKNKTGRTARVRAAAKKLKTFTPLDLVYSVADTFKENNKIRCAMHGLYMRGELKRTAPGRYEYVEGGEPVAGVRQRILRAIHVKGLFRIKDIKILTDAEVSYICALVRRLVKADHIEHIGTCQKEKSYRVKNADQFYLIYIKENRNVPKEVVAK